MGNEGHNNPSCDWSAATNKKGLGEMLESTAKRAKIHLEVPDDDSVSGDIRITDMTAEEIKFI